jgi:hypothetical protein
MIVGLIQDLVVGETGYFMVSELQIVLEVVVR